MIHCPRPPTCRLFCLFGFRNKTHFPVSSLWSWATICVKHLSEEQVPAEGEEPHTPSDATGLQSKEGSQIKTPTPWWRFERRDRRRSQSKSLSRPL